MPGHFFLPLSAHFSYICLFFFSPHRPFHFPFLYLPILITSTFLSPYLLTVILCYLCLSLYLTFVCHCHFILHFPVILSYAFWHCHFIYIFIGHFILPLFVIVSYLCLSFYLTFVCHCHFILTLSVILSYLCLSLSFYATFVCHLSYLCLSFHFIYTFFVILSYLCLSFYLTFVCHCHFISAYICPFIYFLKAVSSHPGLSFFVILLFLFLSHSLRTFFFSLDSFYLPVSANCDQAVFIFFSCSLSAKFQLKL